MLRKAFESAVRRAKGIPLAKRLRMNFHALRHTAASLMVGQGVPLHGVGMILGHSTPAVTARYAHLAPEAQRAAVAKLVALDGTKDGPPRVFSPRDAATSYM